MIERDDGMTDLEPDKDEHYRGCPMGTADGACVCERIEQRIDGYEKALAEKWQKHRQWRMKQGATETEALASFMILLAARILGTT